MLKRQYRLPAHIRLNPLFSLRTPFFSLKTAKNGLSYNRVAFIVRKATDKRATQRNKMKRILRSCVEEVFDQMQTGYDMLFFIEKGIMEKKHEQICHEINEILTKNKML